MAGGCTSRTEVADAAVGLAVNAVGAAVNREVTGECLAQCSYDTYCNHETGFCEARPNAPPVTAAAVDVSPRCVDEKRRHDEMKLLYPATHPDMIELQRVLEQCEVGAAEPTTSATVSP